MIAAGFLYFVAELILALAAIRFVEMTWPDSMIGRALGVIH